MRQVKVNFKNKSGEVLTGILDLPTHQKAHNFAVFAHCFTCIKELTSAVSISRGLTNTGFGVLRFDFTGLGESEGNFADTNFSGNTEDLIEAADFLRMNYKAPTLMIGHSLGGTAGILASNSIDEIEAVVTIGSPFEPAHVKHLLRSEVAEIEKNGNALVNIGGRDFTIKKQFLDDIENTTVDTVLRNLKKSLLIFHSPQDMVVSIDNAEGIFKAAFHPKSFVSLDRADHLLTNRKDADYVGRVIAAWAGRYLSIPDDTTISSNHQVAASLQKEDKFTTYLTANGTNLIADEPEKFGGNNYGPTPYDYVSAGLAACTAMTVQMYAKRKKWDLQNITVHINHSKEHAIDCENCEADNSKIDTFRKTIEFEGNLTEEQKGSMLEIADRCPVHRTLTSEIQIISE